jgi:hypothetical protein
MGKIVRAGARIFDKMKPEPELEPDKNRPAGILVTLVYCTPVRSLASTASWCKSMLLHFAGTPPPREAKIWQLYRYLSVRIDTVF